MSIWKAKKYLGQHFLQDNEIGRQIVEAFNVHVQQPYTILEIGPGQGALTKFLVQMQLPNLYLIEVDSELAGYLGQTYPSLANHIIKSDFLTLDLASIWPTPIGVIGNFPYNISSQIFFKLLQYRAQVQEIVCMVQKEVAERITAKPGRKVYGIPSVLLQAFYKVEYLFTVGPDVFNPPPQVHSAVIRLRRNAIDQLPCNEALFFHLVKMGFQQRRKKLKNALHTVELDHLHMSLGLLDQRAEELSVDEFISLAQEIATKT